MKLTPLLVMVAVATATLAYPAGAQETTATGALNSEMSWAALQSNINQSRGDTKLLRTDVDATKKCGKKNQVWNPDKGCIDAKVDLSELEKIKYCNSIKKFYSPTATGADAKTGCVSTAVVETGLWIDKSSAACTQTSMAVQDIKSKYSKCAKTPKQFTKCTDKGLTCYVDTTCSYTTSGGSGAGGGNNGWTRTRDWAYVFRCQY